MVGKLLIVTIVEYIEGMEDGGPWSQLKDPDIA